MYIGKRDVGLYGCVQGQGCIKENERTMLLDCSIRNSTSAIDMSIGSSFKEKSGLSCATVLTNKVEGKYGDNFFL